MLSSPVALQRPDYLIKQRLLKERHIIWDVRVVINREEVFYSFKLEADASAFALKHGGEVWRSRCDGVSYARCN
jgi:hypothetical protein